MNKKELNPGELLLLKISELASIEPDLRNWTKENFKDNPPRDLRLRQIYSLMNSINIKIEIMDFIKGDFIPQKHSYSVDFLENISDLKGLMNFGGTESIPAEEWKGFFKKLMAYKLESIAILSINDSTYAASGLFALGLALTNTLNKGFAKKLSPLNKILIYLINPLGTRCTLSHLSECCAYPVVDMNQIDLEWF